tara:strand:+ start:17917 stop:18105 length:189 start_codon:yes stop_codon:yes gene_type:complete
VSAWKRWLFALLGSAVICAIVLGVFFMATEIGESSARSTCLENDGEWDYTARDCQFSLPKDL